jgi:hypothetical protein
MMNYQGYGGRRRKLFFAPFIVLLFFALSAIVQYLWNAVLPDLLHAAKIGYWQSAGLLLLCRILFGSFQVGRRGAGPPGYMKQKWAGMNDEERTKFRDEFRERCRNREH